MEDYRGSIEVVTARVFIPTWLNKFLGEMKKRVLDSTLLKKHDCCCIEQLR